MDNIKLFLSGNRSKQSVDGAFYQDVDLKANRRLYADDMFSGVVSAYDIYESERKNSNKIRLICDINPLCSNVLFNPVTEIVKNEGSNKPILLNYSEILNKDIESKDGLYNPIKPITSDNTTAFTLSENSGFTWNQYEAIRDTQISSDDFGFVYHCGIDIFNNHLLRSNTFKIVSYNETNSFAKHSDGRKPTSESEAKKEHVYIDKYFNTIDDWMRDSRGNIVYNNFFNPFASSNSILYTVDIKNFNGKNKVNNDYYATFDARLEFNDPKDVLSLKKNTTIMVDIIYELTEYSWEKSNTSGFTENGVYLRRYTNVDTLTEDKKDKVFTYHIESNVSQEPYDKPLLMDKHLVSYRIRSVDVTINGHLSDTNDVSNKYFYEKITFGSHLEGGSKHEIIKYDLSYIMGGSLASDTFSNASHLYQSYDVNTFEETVEKKLIEDNGWFGFKNTSKLPTYDLDTSFLSHPSRKLDISKPINSADASSFVDMYPSRDLYSFSPKYNKYKSRIEPNWDFCVTYPSSSATEGFDFIQPSNSSLKIQMFDEFTVDDDGKSLITFYSLVQHGLRIGDNVNIYSTFNGETNVVIGNANVSNVYDKYIFQIDKNSVSLSSKWYNVSGYPSSFVADGIVYTKDALHDNVYYDEESEPNRYYVVPDTMRMNLDLRMNNLSFKRVVSGIECNYYVRIFSKIPNFKFSDTEINDYTLYQKSSDNLIERYSDISHAFSSHVNKIGFSKNIYGDDVSEIVFTDDIDISCLKDNLGRPISDIFLTIVKRNKGYKEWYGINGTEINLDSDDIEYSHCFGKNSCAFRLSDDALSYFGVKDIRKLDSDHEGLNMKKINVTSSLSSDEIVFDECRNFYGDLCCYSPIDADEEIIQPILNRFNTAQRDLTINDKSFETFSKFSVDDIVNDETKIGYGDPYDIQKEGTHSDKTIYMALPRNEGYYYIPHYKIPIKTVSKSLSVRDPILHNILGMEKNGDLFVVHTRENNWFTKNDKPLLYDKTENKVYVCLITNVLSDKKFACKIFSENGDSALLKDIDDVERYNLVSKDEETPYYANIIKDGTCRFYWRDVIQNGFDNDSSVETYPFANGALYVSRKINFYLRRQNPSEKSNTTVELSTKDNYFHYEDNGEIISKTETEDNYVSENNMKEC